MLLSTLAQASCYSPALCAVPPLYIKPTAALPFVWDFFRSLYKTSRTWKYLVQTRLPKQKQQPEFLSFPPEASLTCPVGWVQWPCSYKGELCKYRFCVYLVSLAEKQAHDPRFTDSEISVHDGSAHCFVPLVVQHGWSTRWSNPFLPWTQEEKGTGLHRSFQKSCAQWSDDLPPFGTSS